MTTVRFVPGRQQVFISNSNTTKTVSLSSNDNLQFGNDKKEEAKQSHNLKNRLFQATIAALSIIPTSLIATKTSLAYNPALTPKQNIIEWGERAWNKGDYKKTDWNAVRVLLRVTDDTEIIEVNPIRLELLREGANNPDIPSDVVHEAMYTAKVLGSKTNNTEIKRQLTKVIQPYTERVILDTLSRNGEKIRSFVIPNDENRSHGELYDLRSVARHTIAQIAEPATIDNLARLLVGVGNYPTDVNRYFSTLRHTSPSLGLPEVQSKALEWIYKADDQQQRDELKTLLKDIIDTLLKKEAKKQEQKIKTISDEEWSLESPLETETAIEKEEDGIPGNLYGPRLRKFTDGQAKLLAAQAIKFLAQRGDKRVLPAIAQWFNIMTTEEAKNQKSSDESLMVLESLALLADQDQTAFSLLKKVTASCPTLVRNAWLVGSKETIAGSLRDAGLAVAKVFNSRPTDVNQLILLLAKGQAPLVWDKITFDVTPEETSDIRHAGKVLAVLAMASERTGFFKDELRNIAKNPYDITRNAAIKGLTSLRDKDSLDLLADIAAPNAEDPHLRELTIDAILKITGPQDIIPDAAKKAMEQKPFNVNNVQQFIVKDPATGEINFDLKINPFKSSINKAYQSWITTHERTEKINTKNGFLTEPLSLEAKLSKIRQLIGNEFGGMRENVGPEMGGSDNAILRAKAQDPLFNENLKQIQNYLENSGDKIDMNLALPMILFLGKAQYEPASKLFVKMVTKPEKFLPPYEDQESFDTNFNLIAPAAVKTFALEALGNTVDPFDKNAHLLHQALFDPFGMVNTAARKGLTALGKRIQEKISNTTNENEKARLIAIQKVLVKEVMSFMSRIEDEMTTDKNQRRRAKDIVQFEIAKVVDVLGGTQVLLDKAKEGWDAMQNTPQEEWYKNPSVTATRNIMHALLCNGRTATEADRLGYNSQMFRYFADKHYWKAGSGQRGEHGHFDVGHVTPVGDLKGIVEYSEWSDLTDPLNFDHPHPAGTAESFRQIADKGDAKIYSYHVNEQVAEDPDITPNTDGGPIKGLEDLTQKQIMGKTHVVTTNHSYGPSSTLHLYDETSRDQYVDLLGAFFEALGETGVTNFLAAGNSQGEGPEQQFDPIGTQNPYGNRYKNGEVVKNESTVIVAAADTFLKLLAEFSSTGNPLRAEEALQMIGGPGYQDLTLYKNEDGEWMLRPVDGTSFASPNVCGIGNTLKTAREHVYTGMLKSNPDEAEKYAPWNNEELENIMKKHAKPLPGRQGWESGDHLDTKELFLEVFQPKSKTS